MSLLKHHLRLYLHFRRNLGMIEVQSIRSKLSSLNLHRMILQRYSLEYHHQDFQTQSLKSVIHRNLGYTYSCAKSDRLSHDRDFQQSHLKNLRKPHHSLMVKDQNLFHQNHHHLQPIHRLSNLIDLHPHFSRQRTMLTLALTCCLTRQTLNPSLYHQGIGRGNSKGRNQSPRRASDQSHQNRKA